MKSDSYLTPYPKIDSEWVKDLNVRVKDITLSEENIEANLHDLGFGNGFVNMIPKTWATKKKTIDKLDLSKLKTSMLQRHYQEHEKTTHKIRENTCQ